jgi:hypothetical protein
MEIDAPIYIVILAIAKIIHGWLTIPRSSVFLAYGPKGGIFLID